MAPAPGTSGRPVPEISEDVQQALMRYDWPGNVRQLQSVIQSMVVVAEGPKLELRHLPPEVRAGDTAGDAGGVSSPLTTTGLSLDQIEKQAIRDALRMHGGNREAAAKMLGIGERTLYRKLKEYGLK
jgi:DNA-binding NtrC family response regulator